MPWQHDDLADDELRMRLVERGMDRDDAAELVHRRDDEGVGALIAAFLDGHGDLDGSYA